MALTTIGSPLAGLDSITLGGGLVSPFTTSAISPLTTSFTNPFFFPFFNPFFSFFPFFPFFPFRRRRRIRIIIIRGRPVTVDDFD